MDGETLQGRLRQVCQRSGHGRERKVQMTEKTEPDSLGLDQRVDTSVDLDPRTGSGSGFTLRRET